MGFLDKINKVLNAVDKAKSPPVETKVEIEFGAGYISGLNSLMGSGATGVSVKFPEDLMEEINTAIVDHTASINVLYDEEMQFLDVVGESFHQDNLKNLFEKVQDGWMAGLLVPEPLNPYDQNAVMVCAIDADDFDVTQVGHLGREQAKKVQKKIIKYLEGGAVIPVLMKLSGGTPDKPTFGVIARAKTKKIRF